MQLKIQELAQQAVEFLNQEKPNYAEGIKILEPFVPLNLYTTLPSAPSGTEDNLQQTLKEFGERCEQRQEDAVGLFLQDTSEVESILNLCQALATPVPEPIAVTSKTLNDGFTNHIVKVYEWKSIIIIQSTEFVAPETIPQQLTLPNDKLCVHESLFIGSINWELIQGALYIALDFTQIQSVLKALRAA